MTTQAADPPDARRSTSSASPARSTRWSRRPSELYLADEVPWVVGYSGGKDSTAVAAARLDGAARA